MNIRNRLLVIGALLLAAFVAGCPAPPDTTGGGFPGGLPIERVSVDSSGAEANGASTYASISADGRYVAFQSSATNLVAGDTNGVDDIFVFDRQTGGIQRVSVSSTGTQADAASSYCSISADGRYVAFQSSAANLVVGDTNGMNDVFVFDRQTGGIQRVSVDAAGNQGNSNSTYPSINADGRYVAFESLAANLVTGDSNNISDIFVFDRQTGVPERVSVDSSEGEVNGNSYGPSISADGRHVAFQSSASNLVTDDTNGVMDIFVRDRQDGTTERVSVDSTGAEANDVSYWGAISGDGLYVAFHSNADNLVAGDTNGQADVFVHNRQTSVTVRVSVDSSGNQANSGSSDASISADGRCVAFQSSASNLVTGDTNFARDIFVRDLQSGATVRVNLSAVGTQANNASREAAISADGRYVAFHSNADNLVTGDTNGVVDVFAAPVP